MSAEIHAAIVGGAITGVVVLLGVWFERWLTRRHEDWRAVAAAAEELSSTHNQASALFANLSTTSATDLSDASRRVGEAATRVTRLASARLGRDKAKRVRDAANDLNSMWMAVLIRETQGIHFSDGDRLVMTQPLRRINEAVHGTGRPDDKYLTRIGDYVKNGLTAPELKPAQ